MKLRELRKKCIAAVLAVLLSMISINLSCSQINQVMAQEEVTEEFVIEDGELLKYNGTGGNVLIPDTVKIIGFRAFSGCEGLTGAILPKGLKEIQNYAFSGCSNLTGITFPEGMTHIGDGAFESCNKIKNICLPKSLTSLGARAFVNTLWLENLRKEDPLVIEGHFLVDGTACKGDVFIPEGVEYIADQGMFLASISSVSLPNSLKGIGNMAFSHCGKLNSIHFSDGLKVIGRNAFEGTNLSVINIPDSVEAIGSSAFYGTPWMESKLKENPLVIVNHIVIGGSSCEGDLIIPEGVKYIGDGAFYDVPVKNVILPEGVIGIGEQAFYNCDIGSIILPASLEHIDSGNFKYDAGKYEVLIKGYTGTYAELYAQENRFKFESLDNPSLSLKGDVNGDKQLNLQDVRDILKAALKIISWDGKFLQAADIDNDSNVTVKDAQLLLKKVLKI